MGIIFKAAEILSPGVMDMTEKEYAGDHEWLYGAGIAGKRGGYGNVYDIGCPVSAADRL